MPSKRNLQQKIGELDRQLKDLKQMFEEHYKESVFDDIKSAWSTLNDSVKVKKHRHLFKPINWIPDYKCDCGMKLYNIARGLEEE